MKDILIPLITLLVGLVIAFPAGIAYRRKVAEAELGSAEEEAKRVLSDAIKTAESKKKEALVEAKDEIFKLRHYRINWNIVCLTRKEIRQKLE